MLTRLAQSERTTKWFRLWDKMWAQNNLLHGYYAVWRHAGAPGVDGQTVAQFEAQHAQEIERLQAELRHGQYEPHPARRGWIPKLGSPELRPLGIPAVRDRTVQAALRHVLEPIFEREFAPGSHGFRPGRGCAGAVAQVEEMPGRGHVWCVDADLKSYFDTIPHERLLALVEQRVVDGNITRLPRQYLKAGVLEDCKGWQPTEQGTARRGDQSAAGQPVSQPAGPRGGRAGLGDGALGGRLRGVMPESGGSGDGAGVSTPVDGGGGADPASGENAHRQRAERRL